MSNLENVQNIYKAFGEGNVPFILEQLSDDINCEYQPISNDVPWLQNQQGKNNVPNFFKILCLMLNYKVLPQRIFLKVTI